MEKLFVPYSLALLAKEKGFNNKVLGYYRHDKSLRITAIEEATFGPDKYYACKVPLFQQLVDWFREHHQLMIEVSEWDYHFDAKVKPMGRSVKYQIESDGYYTALTAALTEAFKLINP